MRKHMIIAIVIVLGGVTALLYPAYNYCLNKVNAFQAVVSYDDLTDSMEQDKLAEERKKAEAYNKTLTSGVAAGDPFSSAEAANPEYENLLHISDVMATVEIPAINVYLPVYHGTSQEVLKQAVGHLETSSLPVGGEGTHAVLTGHTGLPTAKLFTELTQLKEGDPFYIHVLGEVLAYQVDQIKVVKPENLSDLQIEEGKDYVTLLTCTPYGVNSHRLLVRGERTAYDPRTDHPAGTTNGDIMLIFHRMLATTVLLAVCMLALFILLLRRGRRPKRNVFSE